jgi:hypothetical protein
MTGQAQWAPAGLRHRRGKGGSDEMGAAPNYGAAPAAAGTALGVYAFTGHTRYPNLMALYMAHAGARPVAAF